MAPLATDVVDDQPESAVMNRHLAFDETGPPLFRQAVVGQLRKMQRALLPAAVPKRLPIRAVTPGTLCSGLGHSVDGAHIVGPGLLELHSERLVLPVAVAPAVHQKGPALKVQTNLGQIPVAVGASQGAAVQIGVMGVLLPAAAQIDISRVPADQGSLCRPSLRQVLVHPQPPAPQKPAAVQIKRLVSAPF